MEGLLPFVIAFFSAKLVLFLSLGVFLSLAFPKNTIPTAKKWNIVFLLSVVLIGYFLLSNAFEYYDGASPPFSYYLSPFIYNLILLFVIPLVLGLGIYHFLVKDFTIKNFLLRSIIITLFFLGAFPWYIVSFINSNHASYNAINQLTSRYETDQFVKKIAAHVVKEEIISTGTTFKTLRITVDLTVPLGGKYSFNQVEDYYRSPKRNVNYYYMLSDATLRNNRKVLDQNEEVLINNVNKYAVFLYGIDLKEGSNIVTFDFPYLTHNESPTVNTPFDHSSDGTAGPFSFRFTLTGFKTPQGETHLFYMFPAYTTQQYLIKDLSTP